MASKIEEIKKKALHLSVQERASLAVDLIRSLDEKMDPDAEEAWKEEVERRVRDYREGKVQGIPAEEVFRKLRSRLE
jgi:putative addiction module component (TIGR02574 family)